MSLGEVLERNTSPVYAASFCRTVELAAWGTREGSLKVMTIGSRSIRLNKSFRQSIYAISFSDDAAYLLLALQTQAQLVSVDSGEASVAFEHPGIETAVFSPDESHVYTAGDGGSLRMWTRSGSLQAEVTLPHERLVDICFVDGNGPLVVSGTGAGLYFLDAATLSVVHEVNFEKSTIYKCRPDSAGRLLAVSLHLHTGLNLPHRFIPILVPDRYEIALLDTDQIAMEPPLDRSLVGHTGWIGALSFSPNSPLLASGATDGRICLWDSQGRCLRADIGEHDGFVHDVRFSTDGELLLSASGDGTVRLWSVAGLLNAADDGPSRLDAAMLEVVRRATPAGRISALAHTIVSFLLSGRGEGIEECGMWFDCNLPSQLSRIELVNRVTHLLQVRTEQAFREDDAPRAGYWNWIRLALCARLGPVAPNGAYAGRNFPDRSESAKLAISWLKSQIELPQSRSRRAAYVALAALYRDQPAMADQKVYLDVASCLERAAALLDVATELRTAAILYRDLGDIHFEQGAWQPAHDAYACAIGLIADLTDTVYARKDLHELINRFIHVFSNDAYALVKLERYQEALLCCDRGKTRFISPVLTATALSTQFEDASREEIHKVCVRILRLEEEMNATDGDRRSDDELRVILREEHHRLRDLIRSVAPESGLEAGLFELSWDSITNLVPENGAMIVTLTTTKGGGAFVIPHLHNKLTKDHFIDIPALTPDAARRIVLGKGGKGSWMDPFGQSTQDDWQEKIDHIGATLWDEFVGKISECVDGFGLSRRAALTIIPSSLLGLLPWKAAHTGEGEEQYPLAGYVVSFSPSIAVLRACHARSEETARRTGNPRCVLTSSPKSSIVSDEEYQISYNTGIAETVSADPSILAIIDPSGDLEYARAEGELILSMFGPSERMALSHHMAWLSALEQWAPGYNYLHLACHAVYDQLDPMASYLQFDTEQRLTFGQVISSLDLYAVRLVALSACESGLTGLRSPDEYLGLGAGFLLAGAPAVISTLWPVDDASTMLLMQRFYHLHLQEKLSPAEALASAQEWLRSQTNKDLAEFYKACLASPSEALSVAAQPAFEYHVGSELKDVPYQHPYFWAGFTLVGV